MKRTALALCSLALLLALTAPATAQDWAGKGRAQGKVTDEAGEPIEGAKVTLRQTADPDSGPDPVYTNGKGRWSVLGLAGGPWRVLIDAEGYLPSEGSYAVNPFQAAPAAVIALKKNPGAAVSRGEALLEKGEYAAARAEYEKAIGGMEPLAAARVRSRIADTYLAEGDYAAARAEYEKALPLISPEEQTALHLQIGNSYQQEGKFAEARAAYERALPSLPPENRGSVLMAIARGYDQEGNRDQAIATLEEALESQPDDAALLQLIADLLSQAGRDDEAAAYLARMPEDATLPSDMVLNLGIRLYNDGDTAKALEYFDRAVTENPELPEAFYYRGLAYLATAQNDNAAADFEKLLELDPENPRAEEVTEFLGFLKPDG